MPQGATRKRRSARRLAQMAPWHLPIYLTLKKKRINNSLDTRAREVPRIEKEKKMSKPGTNTVRQCAACGEEVDVGRRVMLTMGWESLAKSGERVRPIRASHSRFICKACAYKALDAIGLER